MMRATLRNLSRIPSANFHALSLLAISLAAGLTLSGCKKEEAGDGAPPPVQVTHVTDMNLVTVDKTKLSQFPTVAAEKLEAPAELNATGAVFPDVAREIPVISLASGRVVEIHARLDDFVKKGDLMMKVQSPDATNAFDVWRRATSDEHLAQQALARAQELFDHGAIAKSQLEQAVASEQDAKSSLTAAEEQLKTLGLDRAHTSSLVPVYAPTSGVIISQNVTNAAAAGVTYSGSATAFTIADLSSVWIICDVYENDLAKLQLGQSAQLHVNAYPDKLLTGRISDIGPVLDPTIRTAKVRLQVANPGFLKLGMFVTATFASRTPEVYTVVPANAVLHLHDRDWVFVPAGNAQFKRTAVRGGKQLPGDRQQLLEGLAPGQQVVANALSLESAVSQ
jgi:cobalt-zinc-cadmium efflux system membrane fusion protein